MGYSYTQDYVRFYLQNYGLASFPDAKGLTERVKADYRISRIITELKGWPCREIKTHKDCAHPLHKVSFLAELGFSVSDPDIKAIHTRMTGTQSNEGPFQLLINIPKSFGGSGEAALGWILSDAPLLTYAIITLNRNKITGEMRKAVYFIADLVSDNGWHCIASKNLGGFHGPGRKKRLIGCALECGRIGLMGTSKGGEAALLVSATYPHIRDSAPVVIHWRYRTGNASAKDDAWEKVGKYPKIHLRSRL